MTEERAAAPAAPRKVRKPKVRLCIMCGAELKAHNPGVKCYGHAPEETPESYREKLEAIQPRTQAIQAKIDRLPPTSKKTEPPGKKIRRLIMEHFGVTEKDLTMRYNQEMREIRYLAVYLLTKDFKVNHAKAGHWIGGMGHPTVSTGVEYIANRLNDDPLKDDKNLRKTIARLRAKY